MAKNIHKYPSEMAERFQVRMPDGLRDRLRDAAAANGRSMNSEIVARLDASFGGGGPLTPDEAITLITRLVNGTGLRITLEEGDPE